MGSRNSVASGKLSEPQRLTWRMGTTSVQSHMFAVMLKWYRMLISVPH